MAGKLSAEVDREGARVIAMNLAETPDGTVWELEIFGRSGIVAGGLVRELIAHSADAGVVEAVAFDTAVAAAVDAVRGNDRVQSWARLAADVMVDAADELLELEEYEDHAWLELAWEVDAPIYTHDVWALVSGLDGDGQTAVAERIAEEGHDPVDPAELDNIMLLWASVATRLMAESAVFVLHDAADYVHEQYGERARFAPLAGGAR